jgi:hypothetical protein
MLKRIALTVLLINGAISPRHVRQDRLPEQ